MDFAVPADYRVKLKRSKKRDVPRPFRKLKKLWNMKNSVIPITIGTVCTVTSGLERGLED